MKARIENGQIKVYNSLPQIYKGVTGLYPGGFHLQSDTVHRLEGFYDVVTPVFDPVTQTLGDIYWDDQTQTFTYIVDTVVLPTLAEAKSEKIAELKSAVKGLYQSIQWYVEMKRADGEAVPQAVIDKIRLIKTRYEQAKAQINALTTTPDVIRWEVPYPVIENMRNELDSII